MNSNSPSERDEELDQLVFSYLEQRDEGVSHADALGEVLSKAPARGDEVRQSLEALKAAGLISPDGAAQEDFPSEVGGYQLKRRLGAGGMGVVFLAENEDGEPVAIKLIRPEQLYFDRSRVRFERELESASRLDHPGVARVLGSGEEQGIPYLAQTWVPGVSFDALLGRLRSRILEDLSAVDMRRALEFCMPKEVVEPQYDEEGFAGTWEKAVLRVVCQVALALEHAHSRDVLHRDVKPSNIMLTANARAVLVDFGLARVSDASSMTRTGAQPGSLPYMAPEQVDGSPKDVDARADVYGLGVTLYELLTLRQPFKSRSTEQMRAKIMAASPLAPRRLNGQITRATEIVCQKAMDRDPRRRYLTAGAFAADLERLLRGEPIKARPPSSLLRMYRHSKHKPAQAAALLFAVALPMVWAGSTQWSMSEVQAALEQEQEARNILDRHLEMSMGAIRSLFEELSRGAIKHTPHLQRTRLVSVDLALDVLGELREDNPTSLSVRAEEGRLRRFRGDVLGELGRDEEAMVDYDAHIKCFRELIEHAPSDRHLSYKRELSLSMERRASLLTWLTPLENAIGPYEEALELLRQVAEGYPVRSGARAQLVLGLNVYSSVLHRCGFAAEALEAADEGLELAELLLSESRSQAQTLKNVASLRSTLLALEKNERSAESALQERQSIVDLLEDALLLEPENRRLLEDLAGEQSRLSWALLRNEEDVLAVELMTISLQGIGRLAREFPSIERYSESLAGALGDYGVILVRTGRTQRGLALLRERAELGERLHRHEPDNAALANDAAMLLHNWGVSLTLTSNEPELALEVGARVQDALDIALELTPGSDTLRMLQILLDYNLVLTRLRMGDWKGGQAEISEFCGEQAIELDRLPFQADLWAEWVDCVLREVPGREDLIQHGRDRALDTLDRAVDGGFDDGEMLSESEVLSRVLKDEPRWGELIEYLDVGVR
jgi:serine/threonine protein kinase